MQEEEEASGAGDATASADIGAGLRPASLGDMRAFLGLCGFLVDLLPLCGPQPLLGCAAGR